LNHIALGQTGAITINTGTTGAAIPSTLFGAFFEEINFAGDGGMYAELVRNRSFNNSSSPDYWTAVPQGVTGWVVNSGSWSLDSSVSPIAYQQGANGTDYRSTYSSPTSASWRDYTLTLQARKISGSEGFLVLVNAADSSNWIWWNIGGWGNTSHALQWSVNGTVSTGAKVSGSISTGQWYDIKIAVHGNAVSCYLNNVLINSGTCTSAGTVGSIGLSTWNTQSEYRNIVVTGSDSSSLYQSSFETEGIAPCQMAVDTSNPLNANNQDALKLSNLSATGSFGAANSGYFGIPLKSGSSYNLSLYASSGTSSYAGPVFARLESANGSTVYAQTTFNGITPSWQKFSATFTPAVSDTNARLVVGISQPGTVWLDMVSLFPQTTFNNRSNGLRPDLANTVASLKPGILRFPGGSFVDGDQMANAPRWKKTIGDVSQRTANWDIWKYTSSNGLGYHEYLQYCEDIGAEPVFDINAGISATDVVDLSLMGPYVQDALDAIEYANGATSTTWGAMRAANGHPAPFNLKFIEIGNENGGTNYNDRYALFYDAIKAAYPQMRIIACVWGGTPTSRPLDLIDEHFYTTPAAMQAYATKYDSYSRSGPHVFVGEYAVNKNYGTYGNLSAALAEAACMTGMERNCDIVTMAAYAPLFCNLNMVNWKPDAIYFNNTSWFGTPSYYIQQMFANNMGTVLLPITQAASNPGTIGLSTWNTQSEYRNIVVTGSNGQTLYQSDFATSGTAGWVVNSGTWRVDSSVTPNAYYQTANGNDYRSTYSGAGSSSWNNYTLTLQARKVSGSEGFLVMFNVVDSNNWMRWNIGGWSNTLHSIQTSVNGTVTNGPQLAGSITTGQWYDIKIAVQNGTANCYLNNTLIQSLAMPSPIYSVASLNENTREIILKSVNTTGTAFSANVSLANASAIAPTATKIVLTSNSAADENSLSNPTNVVPVTSSIGVSSPQFTLTLPANSATILRLQGLALAPQNLASTPGNQQVALTWSSAAGATSYTVKRATSLNGTYSVVASGLSGTTFTDTGLQNGATYYYIVTAVNSAGETATATAVAATPVLPPIAAYELLGPGTVVNGSTVQLTVKSSVPGRVYRLQRSDDLQTGSWQTIGTPQTGTGSALIFTDSYDSGYPKRFYRVQLATE
jgi:alpha-L-arabinofuranosidase